MYLGAIKPWTEIALNSYGSNGLKAILLPLPPQKQYDRTVLGLPQWKNAKDFIQFANGCWSAKNHSKRNVNGYPVAVEIEPNSWVPFIITSQDINYTWKNYLLHKASIEKRRIEAQELRQQRTDQLNKFYNKTGRIVEGITGNKLSSIDVYHRYKSRTESTINVMVKLRGEDLEKLVSLIPDEEKVLAALSVPLKVTKPI